MFLKTLAIMAFLVSANAFACFGGAGSTVEINDDKTLVLTGIIDHDDDERSKTYYFNAYFHETLTVNATATFFDNPLTDSEGNETHTVRIDRDGPRAFVISVTDIRSKETRMFKGRSSGSRGGCNTVEEITK